MSVTISFDREGTKVVAIVRQYDGIDRPEYTRVQMSADEAMGHAGKIKIYAEAAAAEVKVAKERELDTKRAKLQALLEEVSKLETEIGASS